MYVHTLTQMFDIICVFFIGETDMTYDKCHHKSTYIRNFRKSWFVHSMFSVKLSDVYIYICVCVLHNPSNIYPPVN